MPKYWEKQIFTHGRFPEVGQKQKTEKERRRKKLGLSCAMLRTSLVRLCCQLELSWFPAKSACFDTPEGWVVVVVVVLVGIVILRLTQFNCYCNCLLELSLAKD